MRRSLVCLGTCYPLTLNVFIIVAVIIELTEKHTRPRTATTRGENQKRELVSRQLRRRGHAVSRGGGGGAPSDRGTVRLLAALRTTRRRMLTPRRVARVLWMNTRIAEITITPWFRSTRYSFMGITGQKGDEE